MEILNFLTQSYDFLKQIAENESGNVAIPLRVPTLRHHKLLPVDGTLCENHSLMADTLFRPCVCVCKRGNYECPARIMSKTFPESISERELIHNRIMFDYKLIINKAQLIKLIRLPPSFYDTPIPPFFPDGLMLLLCLFRFSSLFFWRGKPKNLKGLGNYGHNNNIAICRAPPVSSFRNGSKVAFHFAAR